MFQYQSHTPHETIMPREGLQMMVHKYILMSKQAHEFNNDGAFFAEFYGKEPFQVSSHNEINEGHKSYLREQMESTIRRTLQDNTGIQTRILHCTQQTWKKGVFEDE